MHRVPIFLSARGGIAPPHFMLAIAAVYALGLAGQWLTAPRMLHGLGLWPFVLLQAVLTWLWFALHARRLRDADHALAPARGIAVIHVLAIMLLLLIGVFFMEHTAEGAWTPESLVLVRQLVTFERGMGDPLTVLGLVACVALLLAPALSIWAALQPGK